MSRAHALMLAVALAAIGFAAGVTVVDDHPNAQKLTIADMRAQLQEDSKAAEPMIPACMKFLSVINSTHAFEVPK